MSFDLLKGICMMRFPGTRVIKTAIAVLVTALICNALGWPPVFAVITAIVTLEPTVKDSIKKGLVRFPASAIGSFYAVLFIALFGNSAITYALAATLTIITCYRLNLHAGLLVATLTAVAMIEVIHDNYVIAFFIRLGTTTIGIVVSTLVNLFIFPPDYAKAITDSVQKATVLIGDILTRTFSDNEIQKDLANVVKTLDKADEFIRYEQEDATFYPFVAKDRSKFEHAKKQVNILRFIRYHIRNLKKIEDEKAFLHDEDREKIMRMKANLATYLTSEGMADVQKYKEDLNELFRLFGEISDIDKEHRTHFSSRHILLYELISIAQLVEQFHLVKEKQKKNE